MISINEIDYWRLIKDIGSFNDKWSSSVSTKSDIFTKLLPDTPADILFVKFNPIALHLSEKHNVTVIGDSGFAKLFDFSKINLVSSIQKINKKFDYVFALDEYFTYLKSEDDQRLHLELLKKLTSGYVVTTLQDYKNLAPYKKSQIDAITINGNNNYIILENNIANKFDKQVWDQYWYCIKDHTELMTIGPIHRRTMYFKQLAKFTNDLNCTQYVIEKNLLYKGFFSKNYEHIITVKFDD